jgi:hypothetical protein
MPDMGLFDRFRRKRSSAVPPPVAAAPSGGPSPSVSLPQLCYDVAYFVLPGYAHENPGKVHELCAESPEQAGAFFYVMACLARQVEPSRSDADGFRWHVGELDAGHRYYVLEYPPPPPVDFGGLSMGEIASMAAPPVLAPHFSALVVAKPAAGAAPRAPAEYFVLGQAAMGGGTTFRTVTPTSNANLGPGPVPTLEGFLDRLRTRGSAEVRAAFGRP